MASNYWIKLYHEMLDDPKCGKLSDRLYRRMIECFLLAGEVDKGGVLIPIDEIAWRLRISVDELKEDFEKLKEVEILDCEDGQWNVINFAMRQMAMGNSERAKRWRDQYKGTKWAKKIYSGLPASPGVYMITCSKTNRHYIGASNNIFSRIKQHLYSISKDDHPMASDVLDYGVETLSVEILELVNDEKLLSSKEKDWIDKYPQDDLYNRSAPVSNQNWYETDTDRLENEKRTKRSQIVDIDKDIDIDTEKDEDLSTPTPYSALSQTFVNTAGIPELSGGAPKYTEAIKKLVGMGVTPEILEEAILEMREKDFTIIGPSSCINACTIVMGRKNGKTRQKNGDDYRRFLKGEYGNVGV